MNILKKVFRINENSYENIEKTILETIELIRESEGIHGYINEITGTEFLLNDKHKTAVVLPSV